MNKKQLYKEIGLIDDDLIQEAETIRKPTPHSTKWAKWLSVAACLAIAIFGVTLLHDGNFVPSPDSSISHPGDVSTTLPSPVQYALTLNKADSQSAANLYIPGHFWQELASDELDSILPGLRERYDLSATANYRGDGTLFNIDAHAKTETGSEAYIQLASGAAVLDYVLDADPIISDIMDVPVTAGYFDRTNNGKTIYFANFILEGVGYYIEISGDEAEKALCETLISHIISSGKANFTVLNPVIPELREDKLTLKEAYSDADFGAYLPKGLPSGFAFESSLRFINQDMNYLSATWINGMSYIEWCISAISEKDKARITSVSDTKNYDLSLYPIPRADSVPQELREIVDNPIFRSKYLTLEVVKTRTYTVADFGDDDGYRMNFGVLYDDNILVEIRVKGAVPEGIFDAVIQLNPTSD